MILYHTSDRIIQEPDLSIGRRNADFGQGFYLSPDELFAGTWARERTDSAIYINRYELDLTDLNILKLERNEKWFEYIFNNRRGKGNAGDDYDVIIGPIANDTLFETYGIITSGFLTDEQALELLSIGPEFRQVAIRSEKALSQLKWLSASEPGEAEMSISNANYADEKEDFSVRFAEALDKMDID